MKNHLLLAPLCLLAACQQRAEAREPIPAPPYTRQEDGSLRVRDDLLAHLRFARVTCSGVRASLQGFGRVTFAPGASYAVRSPFAAFVERVLVNWPTCDPRHAPRGTALPRGRAAARRAAEGAG